MFLTLFKSAVSVRTEELPRLVPVNGEHEETAEPEISQALVAHRKWLASGGEAGMRASLPASKLAGADLSGADLRAAFLRKANLSEADLSLADLRGACLVQANLQKANLLKTRLRDAGLHGATLDGATGLQPEQLGGANLFGVTLPKQISEAHVQQLKAASRASQRARRLFVAVLLSCLFSAIVISGATDAQLLLGSPILPLQFLGDAMPATAFFFLAPLLLLCLYVGFHLSLQRLWEQLADLPAVFPDGQALDQKEQWFLMGLARPHFKWLGEDRLPPSFLEWMVLALSAYWIVPATLILFWGRYLSRLDLQAALYHASLVVAATILALFLPDNARKTVRTEELPIQSSNVTAQPRLFSRNAAVISLGFTLCFLSVGTVGGIPHNRGPAEGEITDARLWAPQVFWLLGYNPYPNLAESDLSVKPPDWTGNEADLRSVRGARLDEPRLRYAEAAGAFLVNARLFEADFQNANLTGADLRGAVLRRASFRSAVLDGARMNQADLQGASMENASLVRVDLREADLSYALLPGAVMVDARLARSTLFGTNLRAASMSGADLEKADLREASLEGARLGQANLQGAYLWSAKLAGARLQDAKLQNALLVEADLRGAILRGALLHGALLRGAILARADLRGAIGLTSDQLCSAVAPLEAQLDTYLRQEVEKQCGTSK